LVVIVITKAEVALPPHQSQKTNIIIMMIGSISISMYNSVPVDSITANKISPSNIDLTLQFLRIADQHFW
jgi:hypothetical protein